MSPATRPIISCCEPRVAEIVSLEMTLKVMGSAPKRSWSASTLADSSVMPPPEIWALPPVIAWFMPGAEMTLPSRTNANWFCTPVRLTRRWLISANLSAPLFSPSLADLSKSMLTSHEPLSWLTPAWASTMSEPSISTGPRMYFADPSASQVIRGSSCGACAGSLSSASQLYASISAYILSVTQLRSLGSVGSAVGSSASVGSGVGYGVDSPSSPTKVVAGFEAYSTGRSCICALASMRSR